MQCREVEERLSEYIDGVLDEQEQQKIAEHLQECAECSRSLSDLQDTVRLLRSLGEVAPPESFRKQLREKMAVEILNGSIPVLVPQPKGEAKPFWRGMVSGYKKYAALAAALVGLGIGLYAFDQPEMRDFFQTNKSMTTENTSINEDRAADKNESPTALQAPLFNESAQGAASLAAPEAQDNAGATAPRMMAEQTAPSNEGSEGQVKSFAKAIAPGSSEPAAPQTAAPQTGAAQGDAPQTSAPQASAPQISEPQAGALKAVLSATDLAASEPNSGSSTGPSEGLANDPSLAPRGLGEGSLPSAQTDQPVGTMAVGSADDAGGATGQPSDTAVSSLSEPQKVAVAQEPQVTANAASPPASEPAGTDTGSGQNLASSSMPPSIAATETAQAPETPVSEPAASETATSQGSVSGGLTSKSATIGAASPSPEVSAQTGSGQGETGQATETSRTQESLPPDAPRAAEQKSLTFAIKEESNTSSDQPAAVDRVETDHAAGASDGKGSAVPWVVGAAVVLAAAGGSAFYFLRRRVK